MHVEWVLLADSAEVINGKLYALGGGWDRINLASSLPATHHFAIAVAFQVPWAETNQTHDIDVEVIDPDGTTMFRVDGQLEVGRPAGIAPGSDQRVMVAFSIGAEFQVPGPHAVIARVDGDDRAEGGRNRRQRFHVAGQGAVVDGRPGPA